VSGTILSADFWKSLTFVNRPGIIPALTFVKRLAGRFYNVLYQIKEEAMSDDWIDRPPEEVSDECECQKCKALNTVTYTIGPHMGDGTSAIYRNASPAAHHSTE
jgi:hypothetical protein